MPNIRINEIDCYYEIHGQGDPLILIAGLVSDSQSWLPVLQGLAQHFKVIIFDNRGIGRTHAFKGSFEISTLALDTVFLLDALAIEKADVLGHSMGGCIAQEVAITYPQRVNKLVLVNTGAVFSQRDRLLFSPLLELLEDGKNYELFIRGFFNLIFTSAYLHNQKRVDAAVKYALEYPYHITQEGFRLQLEALEHFNSLGRLGKIEAETLIIASEKDALITIEEMRALSQEISLAQTLCLENVAHAFQVEEPGSFIDPVVRFLTHENQKF